jgi:hypothetical protein
MAITPASSGQPTVYAQMPQDAAGVAPGVVTPADALTKAALAAFGQLQAALAYNGTTFDIPRVVKVVKAVALTAGTTETTIWTPASGKKFRLLRLVLTVSAQSILTFKDNTAGSTILVLEPAANVPLSIDLGSLGIFSATADNVLTVTRATSATLQGFVAGTEE